MFLLLKFLYMLYMRPVQGLGVGQGGGRVGGVGVVNRGDGERGCFVGRRGC